MSEWILLSIILFGAVLFTIIIGVPIAFALGGISVIGVYFLIGPQALMGIAVNALYYGSLFSFIATPLFILMADVLAFSGASDDLFTAVDSWVGRIPGSLSIASVVACGLFGAACGASSATAATIGYVSIPQMKKRGYNMELITGSVAAGGTLGILIPPSIPMIIYGTVTETSIGSLFMSGIVPGIILITLFSLYILLAVIRKPSLAPEAPLPTWRERLKNIWKAVPVLIVAFAVLGTIYSGIATATEAGGVGALISILICICYGKLKWSNLLPAILRAVQTTCFIFFIVFGAMAFSFLLTYLMIPQNMAASVVASGMSALSFVIVANLLFLFLGCFIDPASIICLTMPTLAVLCRQLGVDLVWFGCIMTINMEMGNLTPPLGLNLYVIKSVAEVELMTVIKGVIPFLVILVVGLTLVVLFPQLALWIPSHIKY